MRVRLGLTLSALTVLQVAGSLALQWSIVARLGTGMESDAIAAGLTIPLVLYSLAIEPLSFLLVPFLSKGTVEEREENTTLLLVAASLAFGGAATLLALAAPLAVPLLVPGFSPTALELTVLLARLQVIVLLGWALQAVIAAAANAQERFLAPAVAPVLSNLVALGVVIAFLRPGAAPVAAVAQVIANVLPAVLLIPFLRVRRGGSWQRLYALLAQGTPLLLAGGVARLGFVVDRILLSFLPPGTLVTFDLAQRMHAAIVRALNQGLVTPIVPLLSRTAHHGEWTTFMRLRERGLGISLGVGLTVAAATVVGGGFLLGAPRLDLSVSAFGSDDFRRLLRMLIWTSGVTAFGSAAHFLSSAYYTTSNTRTPTMIALSALAAGLLFRLAGFRLAGVVGVAGALSLQYGVQLWLLARSTRSQVLAPALSPTTSL